MIITFFSKVYILSIHCHNLTLGGVNMKKTIILALLLVSVFLLGCQQIGSSDKDSDENMNSDSGDKGKVVFIITDAAADMGSVSEVKVTVDSVQVHSQTEGWVTVSSSSKTYDLLEMKAEGTQKLIAEAELNEGTYNEMRLHISKVVVVDEEGSHEAKLPSNDLKMKGNLVVEAESTSTAKFDFIADESLHLTGNGQYIMAPVIQLETRSDADVEIKSNNDVEVRGGSVKTNSRIGMDISGNVGVGLKIPSNAKISIGSGNKISITDGISVGSDSSARTNTSTYKSEIVSDIESDVTGGVGIY